MFAPFKPFVAAGQGLAGKTLSGNSPPDETWPSYGRPGSIGGFPQSFSGRQPAPPLPKIFMRQTVLP